MGFRTKLDFSDNRQVKQRIETTTVLSGATAFGVPYDQLPSGPNYALSAITLTIPPSSATTGTFSGNNTTTVFTWPINDLYLADSTFSAITPSNSASSQTSSFVFTADTNTMFTVDGNVGYGSYTGVGFTMFATSMVDLGSGSYSGTVNFTNVNYVQAPGLDFSGRTIWADVSGITRTDRLIIGDNANVGRVFMCNSSEGMGKWETLSGLTATTALWTNDGTGGGGIRSTNGVTHVMTGNTDYSIIAGGFGNAVYDSDGSFIGAGASNRIDNSDISYIVAADDSWVTNSSFGGIVGGQANYATDSQFSIIAGGSGHIIETNSSYASIFNGRFGSIKDSDYATLVNSISSLISGGTLNGIYSSSGSEISGSGYSNIYGGRNNAIHGGLSGNSFNSIYGGSYNTIENHNNSFILGGSGNTIHFDLEDYSVGNLNGLEAIINSRLSSISASTNGLISNSLNVDMNMSVFSEIRNSSSTGSGVDTEISGVVNLGGNGFNLIDTAIDSRITGITIYNTILGSNNIRIDGTFSGGNTFNNSVIGSSQVFLDSSDDAGNSYAGSYNNAGLILKRTAYGMFGGNMNAAVYSGGVVSIIGTRSSTINTSHYSSIFGGRGHEITDTYYSALLGGQDNTISNNVGYGWGTLIGGNTNAVYGDSNYYTIIGGGNSEIYDSNAAILVSESSVISGSLDYSAILVGTNNEMTTTVYSGPANTLMAGGNNNLYRNSSILGLNNSVMLGGQNMTINGASNMNNMITSYQSSMSGTVSLNSIMGSDNCLISTGTESGILFSEQSRLRNVYQSFMVGTYQSTISGTGSNVTSSFILGGEKHAISGNSAAADYSAIINGSTNLVSQSRNAVIIGGSNVRISGGSDQSVAILAKDSWIESSSDNSGLFSTEISYIKGSNLATIMGGNSHRIVNNGFAAVLGGVQNIISASTTTLYNTIMGGVDNRILGQSAGSSTVGSNSARMYDTQNSIILGGLNNTISGNTYITNTYNAILGGNLNKITGATVNNSVIVGGYSNTISNNSERSVIIGGSGITATTSDTVYVPDLVIDGLNSTDPIATNSVGKIVAGTSDARLKQNINGLSNSLDIVKNLRGVSFEYTPESEMGGGVRYGFIAQEVQQHVPDIVRNRAKGDGMLSLNYNEIVPILVEAVKELSSGITTSNNTHLETQTVLAEDNNIELNFNGNQQTALGGGLSVLHAKGQDQAANLITDTDGNFVTNNDFKPQALTIPIYTPTSSNDTAGSEGNITRDDNYMYIKTSTGWKRTNLENF